MEKTREETPNPSSSSSSSSSEYGFFCDIETAIINEYEEVEFYVATTRTRYEVRRKVIRKPSEQTKKDIESADEETCCELNEPNKTHGCFSGIWKRIVRIPKDVYYSFAVLTVTASCVLLVMY
jgi:hypothetical protein